MWRMRDPGVHARDGAHDRIGDRMIAAERDWREAVLERQLDARLNHHARVGRIVCEREIAGIGELRKVGAALGERVAGG